MPNRYYSNTAIATTLTAAVTSANTVLPVAATTGFPASTPYTLVLDEGQAAEELVTVTGVAGLNLTVTRGVDGTAAASHSSGAAVKHVVSARDYREPQDHMDLTAAHGATGAVVGTTNTQTLTNKTLTSPVLTTPTGVARGTLGHAQIIANQSGITTEVDITGLSVTVTAGTSRRIRISYMVRLTSTVANDVAGVAIKEGATDLHRNEAVVVVSGTASVGCAGSVVITPTAGSHTYKLAASRAAGTGNIQVTAAATYPAHILVEDIGDA